MNEELKIIVRAVTDGAKKSLAGVKEELADIKQESQKASKTVGESMKGVAKGVGIALAAVTALTGAMVALGKSAQDVQKGFSRLTSSFTGAGSSAKEATKQYKAFFGIIGDHDRTIETLQSLGRITVDSGSLKQYEEIMAGVVSKYGEGYNTEALAENISETIAQGSVIGDLDRVFAEAGINVENYNAALSQAATTEQREIMLRSTLNSVLGTAGKLYIAANQASIQYNQSQANLNVALANAASYTVPLLTQLNNLATVLLQVLKPAFETICGVIIVFVQWIVAAIQYIGSFFGLFGKEGVEATKEVNNTITQIQANTSGLTSGANGLGDAFNNAADAAAALKKQTMGFDELNVVTSPTSTSTGTGGSGAGVGGTGGGGISIPTIGETDLGIPALDEFQAKVDELRERLKFIVPLIGLGALAWAGWNLTKFIMELGDATKEVKALKEFSERMDVVWKGLKTTQFKAGLKELWALILPFIGGFLAIGGALVAVWAASDAWVNGVDWGNFAAIIAGLAATVGGLAILFGPVGALIGVIAGAITLVVVGVKDLITNGYNLASAIMATVGAGMLLGGLGASLGAPWLGLFALLSGGFYILYNEFEGFRKFVDNTVEKIKDIAHKAWEWCKKNILEPIKTIWSLWVKPVLDKIVEIIMKVIEIIGALFVGLWNLLKQEVIDPIAAGFKKLWEDIKEFFAPAVNFFGDIFKKAYEKIKEKFAPIKKFFSDLWKDIKTVFSDLGTILGDAIGKAVKAGINKVISLIESTINRAVSLINGAIGIINKLPGVSVEKLTKLELPRLATGGIVTSSTIANIGEAGREAVLPLENNTGWMDILADRIAARNNTPSKIVLALDGKELGWANINSINNITKQTGSLQLVLA